MNRETEQPARALPDRARATSCASTARPGPEGLEILGYFHSHPDDRARPSETDRLRAADSLSDGVFHVVVGVEEGERTTPTAWVFREATQSFEARAVRDRVIPGEDMAIKVQIPAPLRSLTGGADEVRSRPATWPRSWRPSRRATRASATASTTRPGELRSYVRVFVNEEDMRFLEGKKTALKAGDTVAIVPAIAGGGSD